MSAYLLVSLQANYFRLETIFKKNGEASESSASQLSTHANWEEGKTWKSSLNNLRLILQPYTFYHLLKPWLDVFTISKFRRCFLELMEEINQFLGLSTLCSSGFYPFSFMTG